MTTLVFDGDCAFCTSSARLLTRLRPHVDVIVPWQHADLEALGLTPEQCTTAVQWVGDDGETRSGHRAIAAVVPGGRLLLLPGVSWLAGKAYDWVARNRYRLPGGTPACALPPRE